MKLLRVNMTTGSILEEPIPDEYAKLGGRGLSSRIVSDEVDALADPVGPDAKVILATGLLTGSAAPSSARLSVGAKSPLTGGIKEANVGGRSSSLLARSGVRAIILEGKSPEIHFLLIQEGKGSLHTCSEWIGLGTYQLTEHIYEKYGANVGIIAVGPAGERGLRGASIAVNDIQGYPSRHAARGGLGAVFGTRGLKVIVIIPPSDSAITYANREAFMKVAGPLAKMLSTSKATFSKLGTALMVNAMNEFQALPTQNFRKGKFEGAEGISGEHLHNLVLKRGGRKRLACSPGCTIRCSNLVVDENGEHITSSLEYETIALCGSNLMIDDIDIVANIDHLCDDIGVDTIEIGAAIGVYMETGNIKWGDGNAVLKLIEEIREGTERGNIIGNGAKYTGDQLGVERIPHVKGQGFPAYDPRVFKAMGVTFATSPMGADHTAGAAIAGRRAYASKDYGELSDADMKVELSKELQIFTMTMDSMGFCYFVGPSYENQGMVAKLLNGMYGWNLTGEDVIQISKESLHTELEFNKRAGLTMDTNDIPRFFREEASEPSGLKFDIQPEDLRKIWDDIE